MESIRTLVRINPYHESFTSLVHRSSDSEMHPTEFYGLADTQMGDTYAAIYLISNTGLAIKNSIIMYRNELYVVIESNHLTAALRPLYNKELLTCIVPLEEIQGNAIYSNVENDGLLNIEDKYITQFAKKLDSDYPTEAVLNLSTDIDETLGISVVLHSLELQETNS